MKMIALVIVPLFGAVVLLQCTASPIGELAASTGLRTDVEASARRGRRYADDAGCLAKLELEHALEQVQNFEDPREDDGEGRREWKRNSIPSGYVPIRGRRTSGRSLDSLTIDDWSRPSFVSADNFKHSPIFLRSRQGVFSGRGRK